jgi:hypothetical protein
MIDFYHNLLGVIRSPGKTISQVMEKKTWVAVFLLILTVSSIATYVIYPITKVEQAKLLRNSEFAARMSEEQLENIDKFTPAQRMAGALFPLPITALTMVVAAFFIYMFFKIGGAEGSYMNFFSGVVHASVIDMVLAGIVKSLLILSQKSLLVSTSLSLFSSTASFRSFSYLLLSQFDLFSIWYLSALAIGIAQYTGISARKSFGIAAGYFLFKGTVVVAFSYFTLRLIGI